MAKRVSLLFILVCGLLAGGEAAKLNYPRVLLPLFDKLPIQFNLEVIERGCFRWTSSRTDLIKIVPVYEGNQDTCSYQTQITVIAKERRRNTAIVLAEDLSTGEVLRCDVILDVIDQLGVLTTTRELFLEEAPETFELWATDAQGNAFTTLEGVEFEWSISHGTGDSWQQVLQFLRFSESKYHEVPKQLAKFDEAGIKGYMVLLEGINTGTARVSVHLPYPEYDQVATVNVELMVLANIILDPIDVHILVGDQVKFKVMQLKRGKLEEIGLNSQYYLEIDNEALATVKGNVATGSSLGRARITLRDRNVPDSFKNTVGEQRMKSAVPTATLTVSDAAKLAISLLPYNNWITVVGERHAIAIDLFTADNHKITLGAKHRVTSGYDAKIYYKLSETKNGTRIYGETVLGGTSPVSAAYGKLTAVAEMLVYEKIELKPTRVILPIDPNVLKKHSFRFYATGGDGAFVWTSSHADLIEIGSTGLAHSKPEAFKSVTEQQASVHVAIAKNPKISRSAEVLFLPPVKLEIVAYNFETAVGDYIRIHIALFAFRVDEYLPMTRCDNVAFEIAISNTVFVETESEKEPLASGACHLITMKATTVGTATLKIAYRIFGKTLQDEVQLVAFEPLRILNPISNELILPIGSSHNVVYGDGPHKVFNVAADLERHIEFDRKLIDTTLDATITDRHVVRVLCKQVGDATVRLSVYNARAAGTPATFVPYKSVFVTHVYCVKPRFVALHTSEKLRESCPLRHKNSQMHVKQSNDNLLVDIEVFDSLNRKLSNISSLTIDWKFSTTPSVGSATATTTNVASFDATKTLYERHTETEIVDGVEFPKRDFIRTSITDVDATFKIKAIVSRYDMTVLIRFKIVPENPQFGIVKTSGGKAQTPIIENELNFLAFNRTLLSFNSISLFLTRTKDERVAIAQGSGFYDIHVDPAGILDVEYDETNRELILKPNRIGNAIVELIDKCLGTEPSQLFVSVVSIGRLELMVPDRVEKSKTIEAIVKVYDSNDKLLEIDFGDSMRYELHEEILNDQILTVKQGSQLNLNIGEIRYIVTGNELGETKVLFHSGHGEQLISSQSASIQVFPPLQLFPRNATLVIGSSVQIYSKGGPSPDVNVVYSVQNSEIVSMDSAVVLATKLGDTKIHGRCVGKNPSNGQQIVFSEDWTQIFVVPLDNIKIKAPLTRIRVGATMPAAIWGQSELSPMIMGTLDNLRVVWTADRPGIVQIAGIFSDAGIEYGDIDSISVRIKALAPGKTRIHASVVTPNGIKLSSTIELTVFAPLELESPKKITSDSILIPSRSFTQLQANIDDVEYRLSNEIESSVVTVSRSGIVKSSEMNGRDLIIAQSNDETLAIPIEVKNVHYILVTLASTALKVRTVDTKLPQGMHIVLKVTLHDNLGNVFSHNFDDLNALTHRLSHRERADVHIGNNFTIHVTVAHETSQMLAVSLRDTTNVKYYEDFIKLSVTNSKLTFPSEKTIFSVGDIICFESSVARQGNWYSSDEQIVTINPLTGLARIINSSNTKSGQKVNVYQGTLSGGHFKFDLDVRDADQIDFVKSSNIFTGEPYQAHLIIKNHLQHGKLTNLITQNMSSCSYGIEKQVERLFTCRLAATQSGVNRKLIDNIRAKSIFDVHRGTYACELDLITSLSSIMQIVTDDKVTLMLEAQLTNGISDSVALNFVPAISVTPHLISLDQLLQHSHTTITVAGADKVLQKLQIKSSDALMLDVRPDTKLVGQNQYKVNLLRTYYGTDEMYIEIHSPLTMQTIKIPIVSAGVGQKCTNQPFTNWLSFTNVLSNIGFIISAMLLLIFTYGVFAFFKSQFQQNQSNMQAFSPKASDKAATMYGAGGQRSPSMMSPQPNRFTLNKSPQHFPLSPYANKSSESNSGGVGPLPNANLSDHGGGAMATGSGSGTDHETLIYGDSTLISPQKRINRRYL